MCVQEKSRNSQLEQGRESNTWWAKVHLTPLASDCHVSRAASRLHDGFIGDQCLPSNAPPLHQVQLPRKHPSLPKLQAFFFFNQAKKEDR